MSDCPAGMDISLNWSVRYENLDESFRVVFDNRWLLPEIDRLRLVSPVRVAWTVLPVAVAILTIF